MAKSKQSKAWLKEHFDDPFVKLAQQEGYRSRAVYKLLEIQKKDKILKSDMWVVDLGAAPGGWSQVAASFIGEKGHVIAQDILPMDSLANVTYIPGDFTDESTEIAVQQALNNHPVDLVLSDMAPNISGVKTIDSPKAMYLCELALFTAEKVLKKNGDFLVKVFHGEGFDEYMRNLRTKFAKVLVRKPEASRARSSEVYLLARSYNI
ncbi:MAG: 23S rRNA (uridine(2552)-2'-O)-methyltransferase RlmE [Thiohalomonadales bacterium]